MKEALLLAVIATAVCCRAQYSTLSPYAAPPFQALPLLRISQQGVTPFLQANEDYSLFLQLLESTSYYSVLITQAYSQGPTNNTILVASNEAVTDGFMTLSSVYGVPSNASTYFDLVDGPDRNLSDAVNTLLSAIAGSHILAGSISLYSNQTIQNATVDSPVPLPTATLSTNAAPYAYSTSEGVDEQILVVQPTGLISDPVPIPKQYINQKGVNSLGGANATLYFYEVASILVASEVLSGSGSESSTLEALATIKAANLGP